MKFSCLSWFLTGLLLLVLGACSTADTGEAFGADPLKPEKITILGTITGQGLEEIQAVVAPFSDRSGIEVDYQGTDAFTTLLPLRVAAGNPPDLALFPQPSLIQDLVQEHALIPLESVVDESALTAALTEPWRSLGKRGESTYGLPLRVYLKGLVWYLPQRFADRGYEVPHTWEGLEQLTQQMITAGDTPWCLGVESGEASGWVGTDWVEDILLRQAGADTYDRWVNHDIPFTDPAVEKAFQTFGTIALNPQAVQGGRVGVLSTSFADAPLGLFRDPPECYLHTQSNFISAFFPSQTNLDEVDVFPLPNFAADADQSSLVVGAVQLGILRDTPAVRSFLAYLLTPEPQNIWVGFGGHLSPYRQIEISAYPDRLSQKEASLLKTAQTVKFDASDAMPSAVGTGSFWTGILDYLSGVELKTVLQDIDTSWPSHSNL